MDLGTFIAGLAGFVSGTITIAIVSAIRERRAAQPKGWQPRKAIRRPR